MKNFIFFQFLIFWLSFLFFLSDLWLFLFVLFVSLLGSDLPLCSSNIGMDDSCDVFDDRLYFWIDGDDFLVSVNAFQKSFE